LAVNVPSGSTSVPADLYEPNQPVGGNLVLVPGFTPHGKDDRRVVAFAQSFARARFRVLVPDVPGARLMHVGLEDARIITDAATYLSDQYPIDGKSGTSLLAVSYAVGPTILAAIDPRLKNRVDFLVGIGGYHDTEAVTTFVTTGHFREPGAEDWMVTQPDAAAKWFFLKGNIGRLPNPIDRAALSEMAERKLGQSNASTEDLARRLSPNALPIYELLNNTAPERTEELVAALPDMVKSGMSDLTLKGRDLTRLEGKLILIHGREDTMIPWTESMALAATVADTQLFLIDSFSHINAGDVGPIGKAQLAQAVQAVLERRTPIDTH
jgi:pimeloyl-ACP methyl ester carboxylesterase